MSVPPPHTWRAIGGYIPNEESYSASVLPPGGIMVGPFEGGPAPCIQSFTFPGNSGQGYMIQGPYPYPQNCPPAYPWGCVPVQCPPPPKPKSKPKPKTPPSKPTGFKELEGPKCYIHHITDNDTKRFTGLKVPTYFPVKEFMRQIGAKESSKLQELIELGDGVWADDKTISFNSDEANKTLADVGWTEKSGTQRHPIWVRLDDEEDS
ncbi:MAG: hypothetical protein M1820_004681 [Bogoriella megaspora]|nr:MAG: hypothetical protein M1820_004681 [Bogoriella megaspora]